MCPLLAPDNIYPSIAKATTTAATTTPIINAPTRRITESFLSNFLSQSQQTELPAVDHSFVAFDEDDEASDNDEHTVNNQNDQSYEASEMQSEIEQQEGEGEGEGEDEHEDEHDTIQQLLQIEVETSEEQPENEELTQVLSFLDGIPKNGQVWNKLEELIQRKKQS